MKTKRLTDNQRLLLSQLMRRYDDMLCQLIAKAKDTNAVSKPSEKLSQNSDFKNLLLAYHERFKDALINEGLMIPIFEEAAQQALYNKDMIILGQPRSDLRHHIDRYRCDLMHTMKRDTVNVIYECDGTRNLKQN